MSGCRCNSIAPITVIVPMYVCMHAHIIKLPQIWLHCNTIPHHGQLTRSVKQFN